MLKHLAFLWVGAVATTLTACSESSKQGQSELVGTWHLVSYKEYVADGTVVDVWGAHPRGRLMYDAGGRMALQQTASEQLSFASGDLLRGTDGEVRDAFERYRAWFGSYTVDTAAGVIVHHIDGSLYPNYVGSDQRRSFIVASDRLTTRAPSVVRGGRTSTFEMVWERDK